MIALLRRTKQFDFNILRLWGGPQPYLFLCDPKLIEKVLTSTTLLFKSDIYAFLHPWLGLGLLTSWGLHWSKHRKMITPSFHFQILQDFLHVINSTTDRFMGLLETFAVNSEIFDFQEIVSRCTIDVICETAMGTCVDSIGGRMSPIVTSINDVCTAITSRVFSVFKRPNILYKLTPTYRLQEKSLKILRAELTKIIETRRQMIKDRVFDSISDVYKRPKMAFLDNLLMAEIDGKPLSFQDIFEEVSTFIFEGHDTTATSIGFTIYCLSRHAEIQEKVFQEQFEIFGNNTKSSPTYQQLQNMKYLELVIKESLRIFPSVPYIGRTTTELTEIDQYQIPKGTTLIIPIISVASDPRNFPEPYKFKPERFETDARSNTTPFDYVPFSAGPRNCIGQKFAMMELKATISKMIRNFYILPPMDGLGSGLYDFAEISCRPTNPYDVVLAVLVTLKSMNGIKIRLQKRIYSTNDFQQNVI